MDKTLPIATAFAEVKAGLTRGGDVHQDHGYLFTSEYDADPTDDLLPRLRVEVY